MNVAQVRFDGRDHRFGKLVHDIADLVEPATLVTGAWEDLVQSFPEAGRPVTDREFGHDVQGECPEVCVSGLAHAFSDTQAAKRSPNIMAN